jgi:hypothetical protein
MGSSLLVLTCSTTPLMAPPSSTKIWRRADRLHALKHLLSACCYTRLMTPLIVPRLSRTTWITKLVHVFSAPCRVIGPWYSGDRVGIRVRKREKLVKRTACEMQFVRWRSFSGAPGVAL